MAQALSLLRVSSVVPSTAVLRPRWCFGWVAIVAGIEADDSFGITMDRAESTAP